MNEYKYQCVRDRVAQEGYLLLSKDYKNSGTKMLVQCPKGCQYEVTWNNFRQGSRCPYCAGKKRTDQQVREHIEQEGYKLLSEKYVRAHDGLDLECDQGHQYRASWSVFQRGHRCPYCAGKAVAYDQVKGYIEQDGYILLSKEYRHNAAHLDVKCPHGHLYQVSWNNFKQGYRCPHCAGQVLTYDQVKECIEQEGYKLLSKEYKNRSTKMLIECSKGHKYKASWATFGQKGHRCPKCPASKNEEILGKILKDLHPDLEVDRQIKIGRCWLDFYIPDLNLAIEYDGEQHFKPVRLGGVSQKVAERNFKKTQERDKRKNKLCKEAGITLIRIPYTEDLNIKSVKKIIEKEARVL